MNKGSASGVTLADLGRLMNEWARSVGITPESERPYLGKRCGWYPEKPKRKAAGGRTIQARRSA